MYRFIVLILVVISGVFSIFASHSESDFFSKRPVYYMYDLGTPDNYLHECELILSYLDEVITHYENTGEMKSEVGEIRKDEGVAYLNGYSFSPGYFIINDLGHMAHVNLPLHRGFDGRLPNRYEVEGIKRLLEFYKAHKVQEVFTLADFLDSKSQGLFELSFNILVGPLNSGPRRRLYSNDIVYDYNMVDFIDEIISYYSIKGSNASFDSLSEFHHNLFYDYGTPIILDDQIKKLLHKISLQADGANDCTIEINDSEEYLLSFLALISGIGLEHENYCDSLRALISFYESNKYSNDSIYAYWQMFNTLEWVKALDVEEVFVSNDTIKDEKYGQAYQRFLNLLDSVLLKVN